MAYPLESMIEKLREAKEAVLNLRASDAISSADGKEDTCFMDTVPERIVTEALNADGSAVLSEENGNVSCSNLHEVQTLYVVDPIDGSSFLKSFLQQHRNGSVREALESKPSAERNWGHPVISVCAASRDRVIYSVVSHLERDLTYVASEEGVFRYEREKEQLKIFPGKRCVALHVEDKGHYVHNIRGILPAFKQTFFRKSVRPGPLRMVYLTDQSLNAVPGGIAAVMSNGEKITDWLPWLCYASAFGSMAMVKIHNRNAPQKDGIRLSTAHKSSIFTDDGLDLTRLGLHNRQAAYREILLIGHECSMPKLCNRVGHLTIEHYNFGPEYGKIQRVR